MFHPRNLGSRHVTSWTSKPELPSDLLEAGGAETAAAVRHAFVVFLVRTAATCCGRGRAVAAAELVRPHPAHHSPAPPPGSRRQLLRLALRSFIVLLACEEPLRKQRFPLPLCCCCFRCNSCGGLKEAGGAAPTRWIGFHPDSQSPWKWSHLCSEFPACGLALLGGPDVLAFPCRRMEQLSEAPLPSWPIWRLQLLPGGLRVPAGRPTQSGGAWHRIPLLAHTHPQHLRISASRINYQETIRRRRRRRTGDAPAATATQATTVEIRAADLIIQPSGAAAQTFS